MALFGVDALKRRLGTNTTSAGRQGIFSRGSNVYNGGTATAGGGRTTADPNKMSPLARKAAGLPPLEGGGPIGYQGKNSWVDRSGGRPGADRSQPTMGNRTPIEGGNFSHGTPNTQTEVTFDTPHAKAFNPVYAEAIRRANERLTKGKSEFDMSNQRLAEDWSQAKEGAGRWRDDTLKDWKYSTADQGIVHSGINIGQQGEIGQDYLRTMDDINQGKARGMEDLNRNWAEYQDQVNAQKREAEAQDQMYQNQIAREQAMAQAQAEASRQQQEAWQQQIDAMKPKPDATGRIRPVAPGSRPGEPADLGGSTGGNRPAAPSVNGPSMNAIANKLGFSVGDNMDDADYLKIKDKLGIKVGSTLDPGDKKKIDAALRRRAGS